MTAPCGPPRAAADGATARLLAGLALAGAALFLGLIALPVAPGPTGLDRAVAHWLEGLRTPGLTRVMVAVTLLGDGVVVAALAAMLGAWLLLRGRRRAALYLVASVAAAALCEDLAKALVGRPRPVPALYEGWDAFAFPSGHAAQNGALYGALLLLVLPGLKRAGPRLLVALALAGPPLSVALSRPYLAAHWLSDVIGGLALAAAWVGALGLLYRRRAVSPPAVRGLLAVALAALALAGGLRIALGLPSALARYGQALG